MCIPYGTNAAAACICPPEGVSHIDFANSFVCHVCYRKRRELVPYTLTTQGLAPLKSMITLARLVAIYMFPEDVNGRDHIFAAIKHMMGLYYKRVSFSHASPTCVRSLTSHLAHYIHLSTGYQQHHSESSRTKSCFARKANRER